HKGARLTQQVNLPGRFLVYVPGGSMTGISRKLPDKERTRLKDILKKIVPEDAGVIIRTAAEGASEEELTRDVARLQAQWEVIQTKASSTSNAPTLLYGEPDLAIRVIRDVFNEDFKRLVVQGDDAWDTVEAYVAHVSPELSERVQRYTGTGDAFSDLRIDEQLMKALDRKVWLPSGGSLVIDRTEAMTVIDVNTGKFVGSGGNLEQTVTRNNIEAAEEIVRQLRLRDIGGMIVVDFIDMVLESNRDLVLRRLTECLGRDRTKHQVAEVTSLGLVQMTRKRVGQGLLESFSETCDACGGRGVHVRTDPVDARSGGAGPETAARLERIAAAAVKAKPAEAAGDVASSEEEATDRPKRRRRGGRGSGAATVAPQDEMAELMSEPAGSEIPPDLLDTPTGPPAVTGGLDLEVDPLLDAVADAAATVAADPVAGSTPAVSPELEEELTAAERSVSPTRGGAHPAGSGDAQDLPAAGAQPVVEPDVLPELSDQPPADLEDLPVLPPEIASVLDPEPAPAPKRRRRATSRPAGPPTV
ncbi:MAG: Ribonuclease, Rne/Rng family, partial [Frankiales bacterium]|nr:Ribonuclease, Rne/Rng family [Frankiales bacterium]